MELKISMKGRAILSIGAKDKHPESREDIIEKMLLENTHLTERDVKNKISGNSKWEPMYIHRTLMKLEKSRIIESEGSGPDALWHLTDIGEEIARKKICH